MGLRTVAFAALVALAPAAAHAEAEETPNWSIGAGVGSGGPLYLAAPPARLGTLTIYSPNATSIPVATFFVERRVGDRTWLVFGGAGSVKRESIDPPPSTGTITPVSQTKNDSETVSASVGLRRVVTRPGAVVDLSLVGSVEGGYLHAQQAYDTTPETEIRDTGGFAAVTGGIAVERELTGGLGLRISTPLVGASWSRVTRTDDAGSRAATTANVFVTLAPRLELRLAF